MKYTQKYAKCGQQLGLNVMSMSTRFDNWLKPNNDMPAYTRQSNTRM